MTSEGKLTTEYRSGGHLGVVCVFEVLGEAASQLLEGAAKHEDHELREWVTWPDNTRKHLPDSAQGDASCGNGLNNNPRDSKQGADSNDNEDRPRRCFRWPRSYCDDRYDKTE